MEFQRLSLIQILITFGSTGHIDDFASHVVQGSGPHSERSRHVPRKHEGVRTSKFWGTSEFQIVIL